MIEIDFVKKVKCPISKQTVHKIVAGAARKEKTIKGKVEVSVVGGGEINELNKKYRGKNKVTDVLSFGQDGKSFPNEEELFGQIFICYPQIERQAKIFKVSIKEEFARMLVHGLLHIAGYDHVGEKEAEKMFKIQEKIVGSL